MFEQPTAKERTSGLIKGRLGHRLHHRFVTGGFGLLFEKLRSHAPQAGDGAEGGLVEIAVVLGGVGKDAVGQFG